MSDKNAAIMLFECTACGAVSALPCDACRQCTGTDFRRIAASGSGRVFTATTVHRAPDEAFRPLVPYTIALVDLDEGVRLMGHLAESAAIGERVWGCMLDVAGSTVPVFGRRNVQNEENG